VKPDEAHDVDRWRKNAESDGGVDPALRALLVRVGPSPLTGAMLSLIEDRPATAMAVIFAASLASQNQASESDVAAVADAVEAVLARYEAKPKVER
jgi:hypothetical protein